MKKVKIRKIRVGIIVIAILGIVVVLTAKDKTYEKDTYYIKEIGEKKRNEKDFKAYSTSISYPQTEYEMLNKEIEVFVEKKPEYSSTEKFIYSMDYESTETLNQYINITFHAAVLGEGGEEKESTIYTITYDKSKDEIVGLNDVFRRDYENMIQAELDKNEKNLNAKDIKGFKLEDKGITLYFGEEEKNNINLNYSDVKTYIKLKTEKIPSLYQKEVAEPQGMQVDPNKPMVALTLDDGPNKINTPRIMTALEKNNANATFFVLGSQVVKYPDIVRDIDARGFEVGSHTFNHRNLAKVSESEAYEEIMSTQDEIYKVIGKDPVQVRFPYGIEPKLDVGKFNMGIALWNIDTLDWKTRNTGAIKAKILNEVRDGSIILVHDIYGTTAQAIEEVLPILKARGYQIVDFSTLMKYRKN